MSDYKPQFRPIYNFGGSSIGDSKSLVGRITKYYNNLSNTISNSYFDSFKDKSWKEVGSDLKVTTKNDFKKSASNVKDVANNVTTELAHGKIIYASVGVGIFSGLFGNYIGAHAADVLGFSQKVIDYISLGSEFLLHCIGYAGTFILMSKAEGKSAAEIKLGLAKTSIAALPVAGAYPFFRIPGADLLMNGDIPVINPLIDLFVKGEITPEVANIASQIVLTLPYGRAAKYSVMRNGPMIEEFLEATGLFKNGKTKTLPVQNLSGRDNLEQVIEQGLIEKVS